MRENIIEKYLFAQCRAHGFLAYKFVSPATAGVPDRVIVTPSGTLFVELKAPGKKPRELQLYEHQRIRSAGGRVEVIDTKAGVDDLIRRYTETPNRKNNHENY